MQALDLNLASRPFKNNTLLWLGFSAAALLLVYVTWDNVTTRQHHARMLRELESQVGGIEAQQQDLRRRADQALREIQTYDVDSLAVRAAKANEVIRWKAFSWTGLFNQLEEVLPSDVQMSSIHPTFRPDGERSGADEFYGAAVPVVVDGTARNLQAFLELERALIRSPFFARVEPERTDIDPQTRETVFGLRFHYNPEIPVGPPPAPAADRAATAEAAQPSPPEPLTGAEGTAQDPAAAAGRELPPAEVEEGFAAAGDDREAGELEALAAEGAAAPPAVPPPAAAPAPHANQANGGSQAQEDVPRIRRGRKPGATRGGRAGKNGEGD